MKSLTEPRFLALARNGLIIIIAAMTGCTAGSSTDMLTSATSAGADVQYCAGGAASNALVVKDADGHLVKLVRSPGYGWRYVPDQQLGQAAVNLPFPRLELSPVMSAQALEDAATERDAREYMDPLSVFIDGPTGYTFTWTGEGGWKFAGRISD